MIRTVIVSPRSLLARGIADLLSSSGVAVAAGIGASLDDAYHLLSQRRPHLLVLDLDIRGLSVSPALQRLLRACPGVRLLGLDNVEGSPLGPRIRRSGLGVVIPIDADQHDVIQAVHALTQVPMSTHKPGRATSSSVSTARLTPRQQHVLTLASQGLTNRQIAATLGLSEGTVKRHLFDAFRSIAATSRIDAVNRARALGQIR